MRLAIPRKDHPLFCSYYGEIVEEDPDVLPKADSRLMWPTEAIKIPADLLEPDPIEVNGSTIKVTTSEGFEGMDKWKTKDKSQLIVKKEQLPWLAQVSIYPSIADVTMTKNNSIKVTETSTQPKDENGYNKEVSVRFFTFLHPY
uniref:Uncharacterized protein n=1 Tax=Tetranychus urticae TaxID=32264 RepID=T1JQI7_TETUR